jgi:hypothetical protein
MFDALARSLVPLPCPAPSRGACQGWGSSTDADVLGLNWRFRFVRSPLYDTDHKRRLLARSLGPVHEYAREQRRHNDDRHVKNGTPFHQFASQSLDAGPAEGSKGEKCRPAGHQVARAVLLQRILLALTDASK